MAACRPGGTVLLSVAVREPLECFLIDREIFAPADSDDFNQDLLVDDPVHNTDRFLRCVEFVVAGEIKAGPVAKMLAEPWGGFEFSELLRNRFFQRSVNASKILGGCDSQDDALSQVLAPSARTLR